MAVIQKKQKKKKKFRLIEACKWAQLIQAKNKSIGSNIFPKDQTAEKHDYIA